MNTLQLTAQEHFYWYVQAGKELAEMFRYSFDLTEEGAKQFALACERFELARSRAQREYQNFSSAYADATGRELNEETGE